MARNRDHRGGQTILFVVLLSSFFFSLAGLAIDVAWAYVIKARLTTAVDAASLAAVRALGRGATDMNRIVGMVFNSNFPDGFLLASNVQLATPTIATPTPGVRSVQLTGSADAPTFFMRIWGFDELPISAGAAAARRDVNLMLVLDRSGSLHPDKADAWDDVQTASTFFVGQFDDTRDRIGLVTFGTSAAVDVPLNTGTKTAVTTAIANQLVAQSAATNAPQGLWLAYGELLRVNDANPVNTIVFFTDGQPTSYTASFAVRTAPTASTSVPYCASSPQEIAISSPQLSGDFYDISGGWEPLAPTTPVTLGTSYGYTYDHHTKAGCDNPAGNFGPWGGNVERLFEPTQCLPSSWNATHSGLSRTISITTGPYAVNQCSPLLKSTSTSWPDRTYRGTQVHNASKNLSVNIANSARGEAAIQGVRVYSIGLGGWGYPADADFLERVANDPESAFHDPTLPSGLYRYAPTPSQLQQAFNQVASEIFRLVK